MKLGLAQIRPKKGDITSNVARHKVFIEKAISLQASAIFFPELSLTGYEPKLAEKLACSPVDMGLNEFQEISERENITIGMGLPTKSESGILISMIIFQPRKTRSVYSKQELHADELPYFQEGTEQLILMVDGTTIAPAICYESLQPEHARKAYQLGADIYLASVAKSQKGIDKAMAHYPTIAKKYSMTVLMVNCVGYCDNFMSAGQSAAWTKQGKLAGYLDNKDDGLIIFDSESEEVVMQQV